MINQYFYFFSVFILFLSGCSPVFDEATRRKLSCVSLKDVEGAEGYQLERCLRRMLQSKGSEYSLEVRLVDRNYALKMGRDAKANVTHIALDAYYTLRKKGEILHKGHAESHSFKALTPSFYSQTIADDNIRDVNIQKISADIVKDLGDFFHRHLPSPSKAL